MRNYFTLTYRGIAVLIFFLGLSISSSYAQKVSEMERELIDLGFENVSITESTTQVLVVFENAAWKLNGEGIGKALTTMGKQYYGDKELKFIVLNNSVPQLAISQTKKGDDWLVSRNVYNDWRLVRKNKLKNKSQFKIDLVFYPELSFRNIKLEKMYDFMINISPAIEISLWRGMLFTGQVIFPVLNEYGERYSEIRPGFVTISQQFILPHNWFLTATAGLFNRDRFGVDLRADHTFRNERFSVNLRGGITGPYSFDNWFLHYAVPKRVTWSVGGQYYNPRFNLQMNVDAGRFIGKDYGVRGELMRHFKHASIGLYAIKGNEGSFSAGFNFAIALPPYKYKRNRGIRVTTADYFFLEYNAVNEPYYRSMYRTSPNDIRAKDNFNPYYIKSMLK